MNHNCTQYFNSDKFDLSFATSWAMKRKFEVTSNAYIVRSKAMDVQSIVRGYSFTALGRKSIWTSFLLLFLLCYSLSSINKIRFDKPIYYYIVFVCLFDRYKVVAWFRHREGQKVWKCSKRARASILGLSYQSIEITSRDS